MTKLEGALAALRDGRRREALEALLGDWRERRAPAVADALDRLSAEIDRALPAIAGKTLKARHERWLDVEAQRRAVDVGRLTSELFEDPSPRVFERLDRLQAWPPDPRITARLVDLVEATPWTATPSHKAWKRALQILADWGDVRGRDRLTARRAAVLGERSATFRVMLSVGLDQVLAAWADPPSLTAAEQETLAQIGGEVRRLAAGPPAAESELASPASVPTGDGRSEDDLLRLVAEAPGDDAPRQVYADWLQERGLPRGEFLALQFKRHTGRLTRAEEAQERRLLKAHVRGWLGAVDGVVDNKTAVFERGFLHSCAVRFKTRLQRETLPANPIWATVHELRTSELELITAPALRSLRAVRELPLPGLVELLRRGPRDLTALSFDTERDPPTAAQVAAFAEARPWPALERLEVRLHGVLYQGPGPTPLRPVQLEWFLGSPLASTCARLVIAEQAGAHQVRVVDWLPAVPAQGSRVLEVRLLRCAFTLERGPAGGARLGLSLAVDWQPAFRELLLGLEPAHLERLVLRGAPRPWMAPALAPFASIAEEG